MISSSLQKAFCQLANATTNTMIQATRLLKALAIKVESENLRIVP